MVLAMNSATSHRGPDGTAVKTVSNITLGHNRLAIIDLSPGSNQPMTSHDGRYTIVFNGEIYNFRELRKELEDRFTFQTKGDTEVLLAAYATWGKKTFEKLKGIFAFAIVDKDQGSVLLVRDHMGVKPLYYALKDNVLYFSSELNGLISAGFRELDSRYVELYIYCQYVPSPYTLLKGVSKLEPGQMLTFAGSNVSTEYFHLPSDHNELGDDLVNLMDVVVQRQLVSDRRIGLFLSGGIDSNVILYHMARRATDLHTFTVGFELEDMSFENLNKFNFDSQLAQKTAKEFNTTHTAFTLTHSDVSNHLEDAFSRLDEPVANPTSFTKYMLSKWVREQGIIVAFGGDGGDEVFRGYRRYRQALITEAFHNLPTFSKQVIKKVSPRLSILDAGIDVNFHARQMLNSLDTIVRLLHTPSKDMLLALLTVLEPKYRNFAYGLSGPVAYMEVDRKLWLPDESLISTDKASMAHGLEYRVPFLDQDLVAFANRYAPGKHIDFFTGKKMVREAYKNILPAYVFGKKKRGWFSPASKWFRNGEVATRIKSIISPEYSDKLSSMVNWQQVNQLYQEHVEGKRYAVNPIWNLAQLQVWTHTHDLYL